ncbi:MAG: hypothetical protein EOP32_31465 [Rhodococcus sp. (in: high G+C Gram-positive bacteria)]|nr:MAG: hypothetical protein EOP32_31465 [Rhodococcus sp. (in: high G+C Gram-positive bacteria)]
MGWDDFHRRNRAIDAVLDYAHRTGQTSLPFEEVPEVTTIFEHRKDLLLALQAKWSRTLAGYLEYELFDDEENSGMNSKYLAELEIYPVRLLLFDPSLSVVRRFPTS